MPSRICNTSQQVQFAWFVEELFVEEFTIIMGEVKHLWRFAVKGLDRDELRRVELSPGLGFPNDRRWALQLEKLPAPSDDPEMPPPTTFDPRAPVWIHKQCFLAAYTAGETLGALETSYHDDADCLTVRRRSSGEVLLRAALASGDAVDRRRVEAFFSGLPNCGGAGDPHNHNDDSDGQRRAVRVVESAVGPHHFGNTSVGFKSVHRPDGDPSGGVVHIVNAETVRALSVAAGLERPNQKSRPATEEKDEEGEAEGPLAPSRFRPNVVLAGVPAWAEFDWVGKHVRIGGVTLRVLSRTVRCEATNVDARAGSGRAVLDVPELLRRHFPEHGPFLGVYARVVEGGPLRVGDAVEGVVPDPRSRSTEHARRQRSLVVVLLMTLGAVVAALVAVRADSVTDASVSGSPSAPQLTTDSSLTLGHTYIQTC